MEIVRENMKFIDFKDFYKRRKFIKYNFNMLSTHEKQAYKWYIYSNRLINNTKVDKIWEYLNEPFGSVYYVTDDGLGVYL